MSGLSGKKSMNIFRFSVEVREFRLYFNKIWFGARIAGMYAKSL